MRIAVTGAGTLGTALTSRLATTPFTTHLAWVNRNEAKAAAGAVDIQHGLALGSACAAVESYALAHLGRALERAEAVVLTHGSGVPTGGSRADLYPTNRRLFRDTVAKVLEGYPGIVVVVTNPVDLLARMLHLEATLPWQRVLGLGTVVETARLRWALANYLSPPRAPADVWAYAIGTHDEHFVPIFTSPLGPGAERTINGQHPIAKAVRAEVVAGARRVKTLSSGEGSDPSRGTMHPVVEGIVSVLGAMARDEGRIHTVSVLDPEDMDQLFYSMPCVLDRQGVRERLDGDVADPDVMDALEVCRQELRESLRAAGELGASS